MKILYCAIDQTVPGTTGGSVHVGAVAEGLAALGHDVHVLVTPGNGAFPAGAVRWIPMTPPFGVKQLRWLRTRAITRLLSTLQPDVVIERYYNFGGEGIMAAEATDATTVLEVNAPVIDYAGSTKALIDRALIVEPMRRWRERICARADLIVTPSAAILPKGTPSRKILQLEWGADTDRFRPEVGGPVPFERPAATVAIFAGAFRSWHGAINLVRALGELQARGRSHIGAVFVGDGPELMAVRAASQGLSRIVITGAVPHTDMPAYLAAADIGVAPFETSAHRALSLGFYWSPLKIFEYMSAGLPVVAPAVDRIPSLVAQSREGVLYDPGAPGALASALESLADPAVRQLLGRAARERAVREYSWSAHCRALDTAIRGFATGSRGPGTGEPKTESSR
jgi:glycosyltransferase involved in cell wall biosynthesis